VVDRTERLTCGMEITKPAGSALACLILVAGAMSGCSGSEPEDTTGAETTTVESPTTAPAETSPPETTTTEEATAPAETTAAEALSAHNESALAAITTAEASAGGTAFDVERRQSQWEVYVVVGDTVHEVQVSGDGQQVVRSETDPIEAQDRSRWSAVQVPIADAIRTALAATAGELEEADVDERSGRTAWDVQINQPPRVDVYVDAVTGEVMG